MTNLTNWSINSIDLNLFLFVKNSVGVIYAFSVIIIVPLQKQVYKKGTSNGFHNHPPTKSCLAKKYEGITILYKRYDFGSLRIKMF